MKSIILCTLLLITTIYSYSQQADSLKKFTREYYLQESINQKGGAWILTTAGTIGLVITFSSNVSNSLNMAGYNTVSTLDYLFGSTTNMPPHPRHSYTVPYLLSSAGIAGGIVLFIAAAKNKRKAKSVSLNLKMEKIPVLQPLGITQYPYPAIVVNLKVK